MYDLKDYDYELPEDLIAHNPKDKRDSSSLLCLDRETGVTNHKIFTDIIDFFKPGDTLVLNNTRVVPARLYGKKETGGKIEILILDYIKGIEKLNKNGFFECDCLVKASKRPAVDSTLYFDGFTAVVTDFKNGVSTLRFDSSEIENILEEKGELPLPHYINKDEERDDRTKYQTVYAKEKGAVAAPTAGLHFTDELLSKLKDKGVDITYVTLHVGYGTFVPVRVSDIRDHKMHSEFFTVSKETADIVNSAKKDGRRVIAVGTTSVRTLEYASKETGIVQPGSGSCDLFIYPGFKFNIVDAVITNFHLPESTLMMLISAFAGRENVINAYKEAIKKEYRFFSYGDSMLIS
ncbi:MAG: tRNA preQ1(34) S-adenosylmethionine ribosyltransferase-isomerase QueA [Deltaproteobacteria bacterium]|nr:tRNA preQ1(34) S-adenosylmethionine ribosyltransferase-isomerase QueA [Deltaproteobacteria bacterium]